MPSWLVLQSSDSKYLDEEGKCYEYPSHIAHAKKIREGDYLVCTLPKKNAKKDRRIFGIGRVEQIQSYVRDGSNMLKANYGWYRDFSTPYTFDEVGGDPRNKPGTQQSIAPISQPKEAELLAILLGEIADDEEVVEQEGRMNAEIHQSPVMIIPRSSKQEVSQFGSWLDNIMKQKSMNASQVARLALCDPGTVRNIVSGKIKTPSANMIERISVAISETVPVHVQQEIDTDSMVDVPDELIDFNPFDDSSVPDKAGVYVLYGPTDSVLYVGKSKNARTRIRSHREKKWFVEQIVNSGMFFIAEDDHERDKLERILIKFLRSNAWLNKVGRYRG